MEGDTIICVGGMCCGIVSTENGGLEVVPTRMCCSGDGLPNLNCRGQVVYVRKTHSVLPHTRKVFAFHILLNDETVEVLLHCENDACH